MPIAAFKAVREVSSEDTVHSAENLLKQQPGKKWKTKAVGEKSAYVILELEEAQQIVGIDIGNEHSAFVEVLVGKAGCTREDFTEILITCSFMTPIESKSSNNPNRVRCFNQEALVPTVVPSKWQLVKIICTQPFNKHVQYGLSFIKLHVVDNAKKDTVVKCLVPEKFLTRKASTDSEGSGPKSADILLGKFKLREDSPDSESESTTSLFKRWKMAHNTNVGEAGKLSTAAAIREASSPAGLKRLSNQYGSKANKPNKPLKIASPPSVVDVEKSEEKQKPLDRNRDRLLFGDDDDNKGAEKRNERLTKQIEADKERLRLENEKRQKNKQKRQSAEVASPKVEAKIETNRTPKADKANTTRNDNDVDTPQRSKKRHSSPGDSGKLPAKKSKPAKSLQYRPFNQLLRGVVLVISGIQNPDRADLRGKALAMGAKYKTDWEPGCTHLICAFKNTPKYNQVKGKGKIVTRSWIEKCHALKKYLPWRRYALDNAELGQAESDEEILDELLKPKTIEIEDEVDAVDTISEQASTSHARSTAAKDETLALYDLDDKPSIDLTSGSDTEDEIERINKKNDSPNNNKENQNRLVTPKKSKVKTNDIYEATTEEEDYLKEKITSLDDSAGFFRKCKFYLCSNIGAVDKIKLEKYITSYGGTLIQDLLQAHYAVSNEPLRSSVAAKFSGEVVRPLWIYECNDMEAKISTARYLI